MVHKTTLKLYRGTCWDHLGSRLDQNCIVFVSCVCKRFGFAWFDEGQAFQNLRDVSLLDLPELEWLTFEIYFGSKVAPRSVRTRFFISFHRLLMISQGFPLVCLFKNTIAQRRSLIFINFERWCNNFHWCPTKKDNHTMVFTGVRQFLTTAQRCSSYLTDNTQ